MIGDRERLYTTLHSRRYLGPPRCGVGLGLDDIRWRHRFRNVVPYQDAVPGIRDHQPARWISVAQVPCPPVHGRRRPSVSASRWPSTSAGSSPSGLPCQITPDIFRDQVVVVEEHTPRGVHPPGGLPVAGAPSYTPEPPAGHFCRVGDRLSAPSAWSSCPDPDPHRPKLAHPYA